MGLVSSNKFFNNYESKEIIKIGEKATMKVLFQIKSLIKRKEVIPY